jgi:hypothetical protein
MFRRFSSVMCACEFSARQVCDSARGSGHHLALHKQHALQVCTKSLSAHSVRALKSAHPLLVSGIMLTAREALA